MTGAAAAHSRPYVGGLASRPTNKPTAWVTPRRRLSDEIRDHRPAQDGAEEPIERNEHGVAIGEEHCCPPPSSNELRMSTRSGRAARRAELLAIGMFYRGRGNLAEARDYEAQAEAISE
jgi:hypothetical protein